jgi:ATP-binding cassette subfamily C protein
VSTEAHAAAPLRRRVRTPTLLQMEAVECGAAALGSILAYHGRIVPLPELRREAGVTRDGSQASHLLKAARRYGLIARGFRKDLDGLERMQLPVVVFWNFNHFVIVEGFDRDRVFLNDPASGPRTVSRREFSESFTGIVLTFDPGPSFVRGGSRPSAAAALARRLRGSVAALIFCVVAGLLLALIGLLVPVSIQIFVDRILIQRFDDWLRPLVLGLLIVAACQIAVTWLQVHALRRLQIKLALAHASRFLWHVLELPASFYAQRYAGEISGRVALNDRIADVLSGRLTRTVIDVTMMAIYGVVMLQYDLVLTVIGVAAAAVNLGALRAVARSRVDANLRLLQEQGKATGFGLAGLQSIETIKASALESDFFARWAGYSARALSARQDLGLSRQQLAILPVALSGLTSAVILVVGGFRVIDGTLTVGMLVAFQSLMQSFLAPVGTLVDLGGTVQELHGDLTRLDDVLQNPGREQASKTTPGTVSVATPRLRGAVDLRQVTFGYNRLGPPLLENFSLSLRPGDRVAIVGGSGSGKSTLVRLLTGLYEPWSGEILVDGYPVASIPPDVLANSLALVEQDFVLFGASVRENLTLWDPTFTDGDLAEACRDAVLQDVVHALPGGLDSSLAEGAANLSGGQRQRLEIARALAAKPAIVVMDEGTSALDPESERQVMESLRRRGCTIISVAHRLSAIRDSDEIVVLRQGRAVERGTHPELLRLGGEYTRLVGTGEMRT